MARAAHHLVPLLAAGLGLGLASGCAGETAGSADGDADATPDGDGDRPAIEGTSALDLHAYQSWGTGSAKVEVRVLGGRAGFTAGGGEAVATAVDVAQAEPHGRLDLLADDASGDGVADLFVVGRSGTASMTTEVQILDGGSGYATVALATGTGLEQAGLDRRWSFLLGDRDGDARPDLWGVLASATGSSMLEVHVLSAATGFAAFSDHIATSQPAYLDLAAVPAFGLGDLDRDGALDLYVVASAGTASGSTEVRVLGGATGFQAVIASDVTALPTIPSDGGTRFAIGDADDDGTPDLYAIHRTGTPSGMTEVTILSGSGHFQTTLRRGPTALGPTAAAEGWSLGLAVPPP